MSRETVGDEVRSGDLTVEGSVSFAGGTDLSTALAAKWTTDTDWTNYTPTLGGITLGNGTISGRYLRIGNLVHYKAYLLAGSTTTTSSYTEIHPPLEVAGAGTSAIGSFVMLDASAGMRYHGTTIGFSGRLIIGSGGTNGYLYHATPITLADGDVIGICGSYETDEA